MEFLFTRSIYIWFCKEGLMGEGFEFDDGHFGTYETGMMKVFLLTTVSILHKDEMKQDDYLKLVIIG